MSKDINQRLIDAMFEIANLEKNEEAKNFLISRYPEHPQSTITESLDQMRDKALKMKENSNAFAILYGYKVKDKEVELEPEEFVTEEDYKDKIQQITNSSTKLSDKDPRGNRYGKEHNIEFYTIYPNKKQVSESINPKFNQPKYSFEIYNGREWYKGPSADTLDLLLGPNLFMALLDRHDGKDMRIIDVVDSDIIIDSKEFDKLQKQINSIIKRKESIDIDKIEKLLKSIIKKTNINESISTDKWNIGSDKSKLSDEEIALLDELAQKLESSSVNGYKYAVQHTYEDFGAGMQWYTIVCYDKKGDSWQVLNTKEWLQLMNTGDVDAVYSEVISGEYFQDKIIKESLAEMNHRQLMTYMDTLD